MVDIEIDDDIDDVDDDKKEKIIKIDTSPAKIMAHIDIPKIKMQV